MLEILGLVMLLERLLSGEGKLYGNSFIFYRHFQEKGKKKKKSRSGSKLSFFQILGQVRTRECCGQQVLIAEIVFWSVMLMSHDGILLQVVGYYSSV